MEDIGGVWRTIGGRRIFIKDGEDLETAMKKSGKFKKNENYNDDNFKFLPEDEDEKYDKYVEMSEECYDKLDRKDIEQIETKYIGTEESYDFNEALRMDANVDEELKNAMDKACTTYTAKEDMASTRSVDFDYLRNAYGLEIERYGDIDRSKVAEQMKKFIGSEISSKSYTSVSLNESGNGMFGNLAVEQKINMPKGTKMFVADNVTEYEAILGRNQRMVLKKVAFKESKIAGFEKEYGKVVLTYEVINNEE